MTIAELEDAYHRLDGDLLALSERALAQDPVPRVRLLRALGARPMRLPVDPLAELAALDGAVLAPQDALLRDAARALATEGPAAALPALKALTRDHPDDVTGATTTLMATYLCGLPGEREQGRDAFLAQTRGRDDWRTAGLVGMVLQEERRYDEAEAAARRGLEQEPRAAHCVHALAHVHYETGEHAAGQAWLDAWRREHRIVQYAEHFAWHGALHALAQGDLDDALARYRADITPADLADAGSLLWRLRLAGRPEPELAAQAAAGAEPVLQALPLHWPVQCGCWALAAATDTDGLAALARRLDADPRPVYADIVAPLARALQAVLEGRPADAVDLLLPLEADLGRGGGSHAQREVVEDTLVHALLAAGRGEQARLRLEERLDRRQHALDARLLADLTTSASHQAPAHAPV